MYVVFVYSDSKSDRICGCMVCLCAFHLTLHCIHFPGVPYAKPPIGDLRFAKPEPLDQLNDVFYANDSSKVCPQLLNDSYIGEEDCLYLNIYAPTTNPTKKKVRQKDHAPFQHI